MVPMESNADICRLRSGAGFSSGRLPIRYMGRVNETVEIAMALSGTCADTILRGPEAGPSVSLG